MASKAEQLAPGTRVSWSRNGGRPLNGTVRETKWTHNGFGGRELWVNVAWDNGHSGWTQATGAIRPLRKGAPAA